MNYDGDHSPEDFEKARRMEDEGYTDTIRSRVERDEGPAPPHDENCWIACPHESPPEGSSRPGV